MKRIRRTVNIPLSQLAGVADSKAGLEAYGFCILVKLHIVSSTINNVTVRKLKESTHLGADKLKRLIAYAENTGLLTREGNTIHISRLPKDGVYCKIKHSYRKRNRKDNNLNFGLTLRDVVEKLREMLIANHIRKTEKVRQIIEVTKNPSDLKSYKKAVKQARHLAVWDAQFFISNRRLAEVACCSTSKMRKIKRGLICRGKIERTFSNTLLCDDAEYFDLNFFRQNIGDDRFIFTYKGKVYRHNPNIYKYKGKDIIVCSQKKHV